MFKQGRHCFWKLCRRIRCLLRRYIYFFRLFFFFFGSIISEWLKLISVFFCYHYILVSLDCGKTSSENCTYLVQDATTAPDDTCCEYTLCPASSNICRIKLDLTVIIKQLICFNDSMYHYNNLKGLAWFWLFFQNYRHLLLLDHLQLLMLPWLQITKETVLQILFQ